MIRLSLSMKIIMTFFRTIRGNCVTLLQMIYCDLEILGYGKNYCIIIHPYYDYMSITITSYNMPRLRYIPHHFAKCISKILFSLQSCD